MNPLISVIIPCYNSAKYISHAIDAIICQTYKNLEIIIVDDNSTDNLEEVVKPYLKKYDQIKYFSLPYDDPHRFSKEGQNINAGWMARNYGVEKSSGELITFQDADDGSYSNRIEFQYETMERFNSHHVSIDWCRYSDEKNCKYLDVDLDSCETVSAKNILDLARKNKCGIFKNPFGRNEDNSRLEKFIRKVNRKWCGEPYSYPCAANSSLFSRSVFEKCHFRPLWERTTPSLRGRGADQDFNYWVAEVFKDSIAVKAPLYLWRVTSENIEYKEIGKF